jgi:hypothetical protein
MRRRIEPPAANMSRAADGRWEWRQV